MKTSLAALLCLVAEASAQTPKKPALVVTIVVDQFRYDYLSRFASEYKSGLATLLRDGAVFTNARYQQAPTVTAVGHSIIMTGAMPSVSGIIGNNWFDRAGNKQVTSVCDFDYKTIGGFSRPPGPRCDDADPSSPRRLLVSTVGDELRNVSEESKVIGISLKGRSAILPSGHRSTGAFWFDDEGGNFISSTYYFPELPAWVRDFNSKRLPDEYIEKKWPGFDQWDFHSDTLRKYDRLPASPWGNELLIRLATAAIDAEKLGQRGVTDILAVSLSSNDYVGHAVGPDAPEVRDMSLRTDQLLGDLFAAIDRSVGMKNVVVAFSADHGVSPAPAKQAERKMPGGYIFIDLEDLVRSALNQRFGDAEWTIGSVDNAVYLSNKALDAAQAKGHPRSEIYRVAREAILAMPQAHAVRVFDRDQLMAGVAGDDLARRFVNGFFANRSGDLIVVFEPYWMASRPPGTTHFSPYNYDTHVPVILMGPGIKAGRYFGNIAVNDIAPTLAQILDVEIPSGSSGRVLAEALSTR